MIAIGDWLYIIWQLKKWHYAYYYKCHEWWAIIEYLLNIIA